MYLPELLKILSLASLLCKLSKGEPRYSLVALAWTLRNREKSSRTRAVGARPWNILSLLNMSFDKGFCSSLAIVSLVWSGEEADPTAGATHFHRHDDWPDWAQNAQPVALIGNWFFYNEIGAQSKA